MDKRTFEVDINKCIAPSRSSRIFYRSEQLIQLNALHEELEKQCEQLRKELREIKSRKLSRRRTI